MAWFALDPFLALWLCRLAHTHPAAVSAVATRFSRDPAIIARQAVAEGWSGDPDTLPLLRRLSDADGQRQAWVTAVRGGLERREDPQRNWSTE